MKGALLKGLSTIRVAESELEGLGCKRESEGGKWAGRQRRFRYPLCQRLNPGQGIFRQEHKSNRWVSFGAQSPISAQQASKEFPTTPPRLATNGTACKLGALLLHLPFETQATRRHPNSNQGFKESSQPGFRVICRSTLQAVLLLTSAKRD